MGSLFDFLKKDTEEEAPEEQEDTSMNALDNLIEELQEALKKDPAMAFDVYKCAGVSADRPKKRSARFLEVSSKRDELEALKKELDETRKELNSVEKACINKFYREKEEK